MYSRYSLLFVSLSRCVREYVCVRVYVRTCVVAPHICVHLPISRTGKFRRRYAKTRRAYRPDDRDMKDAATSEFSRRVTLRGIFPAPNRRRRYFASLVGVQPFTSGRHKIRYRARACVSRTFLPVEAPFSSILAMKVFRKLETAIRARTPALRRGCSATRAIHSARCPTTFFICSR